METYEDAIESDTLGLCRGILCLIPSNTDMDSTKQTTSNEKGASTDTSSLAKKAKKNSDSVNYIWLVKTVYVDDNGQDTENLIGAFSSKESAIQNAKVTMKL